MKPLAFIDGFAIVSFNPSARAYSMRRYTAGIKDGSSSEVGDRIMQGGKAVRFFEMNLTRLGDTNWPVAGTAAPK